MTHPWTIISFCGLQNSHVYESNMGRKSLAT